VLIREFSLPITMMHMASAVSTSTRSLGLIGGIDFGAVHAEKAKLFQQRAQQAGIIVERCGRNGEVVS